jgi:hypothetical protein
MRTFAQKQNQPQKPVSSSPTRSKMVTRRPDHREHPILHLQRTIGNQAVQQLLKASARDVNAVSATTASTRFAHDFSRIPLQAKTQAAIWPEPAISSPGHIYEQEADRVADQVMSMPTPVGWGREHGNASSQMTDERVQRKPAVGDGIAVSQELSPHSQSERSNQPLSSEERAFFEPRFGHDFSRVRINADSRSAEMADALNAEAFTVGRDIYFGAGKLRPRNTESDRLLAHELAHVEQQSRMGPALQPKLKITGKAGHVTRAIALLNSWLQGYRVSIKESGEVSISMHTSMNLAEPKPNAQQKALAARLSNVIDDPKEVLMTVSAGSGATIGGSFATGDFDIADLETYGVAGLIHEIEEQYQKQVKGLDFGSETTGAHKEASKAESEVRGAKRGPQKNISSTANADGTFDAVIEIPHTFPDGKVKTMVMTVKGNNIVSVKWK